VAYLRVPRISPIYKETYPRKRQELLALKESITYKTSFELMSSGLLDKSPPPNQDLGCVPLVVIDVATEDHFAIG